MWNLRMQKAKNTITGSRSLVMTPVRITGLPSPQSSLTWSASIVLCCFFYIFLKWKLIKHDFVVCFQKGINRCYAGVLRLWFMTSFNATKLHGFYGIPSDRLGVELFRDIYQPKLIVLIKISLNKNSYNSYKPTHINRQIKDEIHTMGQSQKLE